MSQGAKQVELLSDAFNLFKDASTRLEQQYALLERKVEELNAEIAEKNKAMERNRRLAAMGEMAARIAHEIRNPLGSMAIFASLLERELSTEPEKLRLAERISKGVRTLDTLLTNMLLFSAAPEARLSAIDLREIIEDSVTLASGRGKGGVKVNTSFEGPVTALGDGGLLRQLFLNLVINAMDAVGEEGEITLATRAGREPGSVEIEVTDNGCGMPPEVLDRVFDPFFTTKDRGTGLGLAIVTTVVSAHRGYIDVSSEEGKGTRFLITLPGEKTGKVVDFKTAALKKEMP